MADTITDLKQWINNETITARDYVYERDLIVNTVNEIIGEVDQNTGDLATEIPKIAQNISDITDLQNNKLNRDGSQPMTGNLDMDNNDITIQGKVNDTTFGAGGETSDAVRYSELANVFDVSVGDGNPNYTTTLKTNVAAKFSEYVKEAEIGADYLRRDGANSMTANLDVGSNDITNVGNVDGVDVSQLKTTTDNHIAATNNPHSTTAAQVGAYTVEQTNSLLDGKSDVGHTHPISDVTSLQTTLDTLQSGINALSGAFVFRGVVNNTTAQVEADTTLLTARIDVLLDRTPQTGDVLKDTDGGEWYYDGGDWRYVGQSFVDLSDYYDKEDSDARFAPISHTHVEQDITDLDKYTQAQVDTFLNGKADTEHTHVEADITDLDKYTQAQVDTFLQGKANVEHTHVENDIIDLDKYTTEEVDGFLANKLDVGVLASNIILYPTSTPADVTNYFKLVTSPDDPDYDSVATDITTVSITGQNILLAELVSEPGLFIGNPGIINVPVVGQIRKTSPNPDVSARFYFEIYQRDEQGTETLLGTSNETQRVGSIIYEEFNANALLNNGVFTETDRLVFKFYGNKVSPANGTYDFKFGGEAPVRILLNVPIATTLQADRVFYNNATSELDAENVQDAIDEVVADLDQSILDTTTALATKPTIDPITGKIPASVIPLQFEDVIQGYFDAGVFYEDVVLENQITGEEGKLYIDLLTNKLYRFEDTTYQVIIDASDITSIGDIPGVVITLPSTNQALVFNGTNWVNDDIPRTITALSDTSINNLTTGQVFTWNGTNWVNQALPDFSTTLVDLDDTNITTPVNNDFLVHDGTEWKNRQITKTDVGLNNVQNYGVASQAEAEAGTVDNKYMTPLKTKQAILELAPEPDLSPYALDQDLQNHVGATNNPHSVTKTQVGLSNVDNTSDLNKPISTATQSALNGKEPANANIQTHISRTDNPHSVTTTQIGAEPANANIQTHISSTTNPHNVTKTQVGLGNVDNVQQIPLTQKGAANGVASLDANSKVPLNQLPDTAKQQTYVVATFANLPTTNVLSGDKGYVTGTGDSYIWNGSSWLTLAEADWENVNLDYGNITNPPSIGNGTLTVQGNSGLTGSGTFTANQSTNSTITLSHANTSNQASVDNSGNTFIQDVTLDGYGHITGLGTAEVDLSTAGQVGDFNLSLGESAFSESNGGFFNVALGYDALDDSVNTSNSIAIGTSALGSIQSGNENIALGLSSMGNVTGTVSTTRNNIAIGSTSMRDGISGFENIGIGRETLKNISGSNNIAIGTSAMANNTVTGGSNIAIGAENLKNNTSGNSNVSVGLSSSLALTTGSRNVVLGPESLQSITTGNDNIAIGYRSATSLSSSSSNNIVIGKNTGGSGVINEAIIIGDQIVPGFGVASESVLIGHKSNTFYPNAIVIGYEASSDSDNSVQLGNSSVTKGRIGDDPIVKSATTNHTMIWTGTQAEYNGLASYDTNTLYFISG